MLSLLTPFALMAATHVVIPDGTGDFPTIQAAIDAAEDGDIVELTNGTFTGPGNRGIDYLGKAITVRSRSGDPDACIIDCEEQDRGFILNTGEGPMSVLEGVTISNGRRHEQSGGGMYCEGSSPTIRTCTFLGNSVSADMFDPGGEGGGLYLGDSNATLDGCRFVQNSSNHGGGLYCQNSSPSLTNCAFEQNWAASGRGGRGGGMGIGPGSAPTLDSCTFLANECPALAGEGGALYLRETSSATLTRCTLWGNAAEAGSGISNLDGQLTLINTIIAFGRDGRAILGCTTVRLTCCNLFGNSGGDWSDCLEDQLGMNGNFSADPLFCDPLNGELTLDADSPCLPGNHPDGDDCGLIGAWEHGCGATPTIQTTWGRIKGRQQWK